MNLVETDLEDLMTGFCHGSKASIFVTIKNSILNCSPGIFLGGKGHPAHNADNLTVIYELIIYKM
jgi:hypothetical protein